MLDLIASYLVIAVNKLFDLMPMSFNLWLGRRIGFFIYVFSGNRKKVTYSNLKAAFYSEKTPKELRRLTKMVYRHMGETFVELVAMTKVDKAYVEKYIKVHNLDRLERASRNPKGMVFVSAHFGNWELSCVAAVNKGYVMHLIARDQKMQRLNELFNKLRESKGNFVIRKGMDIKNVFKVLHAGKTIGLLGDQNAGVNGQLVDFFGRPASLAQGPYRFAQKCGAWVLPAFIWRVKGPYHEVMIEEPLEIKEGEDLLPYMRRYNELLEKHIKAHPDQWFWMHKRWKVTPLKKILVLDDGKKGHLKQSLAVVKQIKNYRRDKGFSEENTPVDIVRIGFRSIFRRSVFSVLSRVASRKAQGKQRLLEWALDSESYQNAIMRYADVIVSCGSALSGVNAALKSENYGRSVAVLDPGPIFRKRFDVVVIPAHDLKGMKPTDNMALTDLAPNLIEPSVLADIPVTPKPEGSGPCIGLLIGGDNKYFEIGPDVARAVAVGVKSACGRTGGRFYVTTSRRTSPEAEAILKEMLGADTRSAGFVIGREDPDERTVEKILAASDVIVVSGESISMVSEAVSSGKPVFVFMPTKKTHEETKYEKFVKRLALKGYLKRVGTEQIAPEVACLVGRKTKFALPEDNKRIYEKIYRLF